MTCTRISKIKLDDLLTDFDAPTLQTFQAQKLCMIQHLKRISTRVKGERTYKHSCVIDLNGLSLSMLAGMFSFFFKKSLVEIEHTHTHHHHFNRRGQKYPESDHVDRKSVLSRVLYKMFSSMHRSSSLRFGISSHLGFIRSQRQRFES